MGLTFSISISGLCAGALGLNLLKKIYFHISFIYDHFIDEDLHRCLLLLGRGGFDALEGLQEAVYHLAGHIQLLCAILQLFNCRFQGGFGGFQFVHLLDHALMVETFGHRIDDVLDVDLHVGELALCLLDGIRDLLAAGGGVVHSCVCHLINDIGGEEIIIEGNHHQLLQELGADRLCAAGAGGFAGGAFIISISALASATDRVLADHGAAAFAAEHLAG